MSKLPFEIRESKYDPRHIGLPYSKVYYLALERGGGWKFMKRADLFPYFHQLDNSEYTHNVQVFKLFKPTNATGSYYAFIKVYDRLMQFMDDSILTDYKFYIDNLDPQGNLINQLLKNVRK